MANTEPSLDRAKDRMKKRRANGHAIAARYDRRTGRVIVTLNNELELSFPARLAEGLADGTHAQLQEIAISPSGLGLHWPQLDADLYIPGLLAGSLGSRKWMAAQLGAAGGQASTQAKAASSRINGQKGGRPRKAA